MGIFKKKIVKKTYDREHMKPVIRASICTGEEVDVYKRQARKKSITAARHLFIRTAPAPIRWYWQISSVCLLYTS